MQPRTPPAEPTGTVWRGPVVAIVAAFVVGVLLGRWFAPVPPRPRPERPDGGSRPQAAAQDGPLCPESIRRAATPIEDPAGISEPPPTEAGISEPTLCGFEHCFWYTVVKLAAPPLPLCPTTLCWELHEKPLDQRGWNPKDRPAPKPTPAGNRPWQPHEGPAAVGSNGWSGFEPKSPCRCPKDPVPQPGKYRFLVCRSGPEQ